MKMKMFVIFDHQTEVYHNPFYAQSTGEAKRMLYETAKDPETKFNMYPEDYTVFVIGNYDTEDAKIVLNEVKKSIGSILDICVSFKKKSNLQEHMEEL